MSNMTNISTPRPDAGRMSDDYAMAGWQVIDLQVLVYWPALVANIILITVVIATASLRRRINSPLLVTTCVTSLLVVIIEYISHFHRYTLPVFFKMKFLCEFMTMLIAVMRVSVPHVYLMLALERLITLDPRKFSIPTSRLRRSHIYLMIVLIYVYSLIIVLIGTIGFSGFRFEITMDGDYVCYIPFTMEAYYTFVACVLVLPTAMAITLEVCLITLWYRTKYGTLQNVPVRMQEESTDTGHCNDAGIRQSAISHVDSTQVDTAQVDSAQVDSVQMDSTQEEAEVRDSSMTLHQMALVSWVSLLAIFIPFFLQAVLHLISWHVSYVPPFASRILDLFTVAYPLSWLILDKEIRAAYWKVCCLCWPSRQHRDDEEHLVQT